MCVQLAWYIHMGRTVWWPSGGQGGGQRCNTFEWPSDTIAMGSRQQAAGHANKRPFPLHA